MLQLNCDPHFMCYSNPFVISSSQDLKMEEGMKGPVWNSYTHFSSCLSRDFEMAFTNKNNSKKWTWHFTYFSVFVSLLQMFNLFDYLVLGYSSWKKKTIFHVASDIWRLYHLESIYSNTPGTVPLVARNTTQPCHYYES